MMTEMDMARIMLCVAGVHAEKTIVMRSPYDTKGVEVDIYKLASREIMVYDNDGDDWDF